MNRNFQQELEQIIKQEKCEEKDISQKPTLLMHSCCAPCSSYCMEYLRRYFRITILYYNPNITNQQEYEHRVQEQKRLIDAYNQIQKDKTEIPLTKIEFLEGRYDPKEFIEIARGYEEVPEGGERCFRCYRLRLTEAAVIAAREKFDYLTTTLTISPLKNAEKLNQIGEELAKKYQVAFLPSDFKKKNGYKRSTELSREYNLYRQDYCGCSFSKAERERQKEKANLNR